MNKSQIDEFVNDTRKPNPRRGALIIVAMSLDKMLKEDMLSEDDIDTIYNRMVHIFDDIDVGMAVELQGLLELYINKPKSRSRHLFLVD